MKKSISIESTMFVVSPAVFRIHEYQSQILIVILWSGLCYIFVAISIFLLKKLFCTWKTSRSASYPVRRQHHILKVCCEGNTRSLWWQYVSAKAASTPVHQNPTTQPFPMHLMGLLAARESNRPGDSIFTTGGSISQSVPDDVVSPMIVLRGWLDMGRKANKPS